MMVRLNKPKGFSLIELMVAVGISATLSGTAIPAYSTYRDKAKLTVAEVNMQTALNDFSVKNDFSPSSGMLADLVAEGAIREIPNDPWTDKKENVTGAEEAADWYYKNDGKTLIIYPLSHPDDVIKLTSFGLPPIGKGTPVAKTGQPSSTAAPTKQPVDLTTMAGADIAGLSAADIAKLSPEQIAMMSAADFGKLNAAQMAALTKSQQAERAIADGVRAMRQEQFPSVAPNHMKYITPVQLAAVKSAWWFGKIPAASRDQLSKTQIQSLSDSIAGSNAGKLTAQQIGWLKPTQLGSVKGGYAIVNILKKAPTMIAKITPAQISSVKNGWWMGQLVKTVRANLTKTQVQAIPLSGSGVAGSLSAQQFHG